MNAVDLVLASASPRRRELLERLGLRLAVVPADIDETPHTNESARVYVRRVAREKCVALEARRAAHGIPDTAAIVAADTTVILDDAILGKPADEAEAAAMLASLSGRRHEVVTAYCICFGGKRIERAVSTEVSFRSIDAAEAAAYVACGEWRGKAGGYAVQGKAAVFVTDVRGSITNVIGLPLAEVVADLRAAQALPMYPPAAFGGAE
ncbi:MAG: Maf family nucleotide pyrophosphatase [Deltaproteobacteria bacterium]|nr:Maf family nucleotide pyrophosphatase [Deltaproteobacteria bacterium]